MSPVATTLTGTNHQVTVTPAAGSITLSTPQNIHSGATVTFLTLALTGNQLMLGTSLTIVSGTFSAARTYTIADTGVSDTFTMQSQLRKRNTMWHDEATVIKGGAITFTQGAANAYNGYWAQATPSLNDTFSHSFSCQAGTYNINMLAQTANSNGMVTWSIDGNGAPLATIDLYSSGAMPVTNVHLSASLGSLSAGYHSLQGQARTKNSGSSGYALQLVKYWIAPASD
jgi:hypothetical protein